MSFHWVIKQIANSKEGNSMKQQFKNAVQELMRNDEEIAEAVCDTAGQDSEPDDNEQTADAIKNKAKLLEKKKLYKRLKK